MKTLNATVLMILFTGACAYAGGGASDGGGGGNALVCFSDRSIPSQILDPKRGEEVGDLNDKFIPYITSVKMLDLVDAEKDRGYVDGPRKAEIIGIRKGESPYQYAKRIGDRFRRVIPQLSFIIDEGIGNFPEALVKYPKHGVKKVNDTRSLNLVHPECVLATMAIQFRKGNSHFMEVDARLYNHPKHGEQSKGMLWLHEFAYSYARSMGQTDAQNTRLLLSEMITKNDGMTVDGMIQLAQDLGFMPQEVTGYATFQPYPNAHFSYPAQLVRWADVALAKLGRQLVREYDAKYAGPFVNWANQAMKAAGESHTCTTTEACITWTSVPVVAKTLQHFEKIRTATVLRAVQEFFYKKYYPMFMDVPGASLESMEALVKKLRPVIDGTGDDYLSRRIAAYVHTMDSGIRYGNQEEHDLSGIFKNVESPRFDLNYLLPTE